MHTVNYYVDEMKILWLNEKKWIHMNKNKNVIAIVDDDDDLLQMLLFAFEAQGFSTKGFKTGKEALSFFDSDKNISTISLLILDRLLPDMDGIEILKHLNKKYPNQFPILILSVLSADTDVIKGLQLGAVEYIGKPFNLDILIQQSLSLINRFS